MISANREIMIDLIDCLIELMWFNRKKIAILRSDDDMNNDYDRSSEIPINCNKAKNLD